MEDIKPNSRITRLGPYVLLAATVLVFLWRVVLLGELPFRGDIITQFFVWKIYSVKTVLSGHLPLWNPHIFCGYPFLANMQSAVFYPLDVFCYLIPIIKGFGMSLFLHFILAAFGTYALCRTWGVSIPGSIFGSLCFTFNGYIFIHIMAGNIITSNAASWIPAIWWSLLRINRASGRARLGWIGAAALFIGGQILSGHPQLVFYTGVFTIIFILTTLSRKDDPDGLTINIRSLPYLFISALLAAGISAVQLLPTIAVSRIAQRSQISFEQATEFSVPWWKMLTFGLPELQGTMANGSYWGRYDEWCSGYIGVLPVIILFSAFILWLVTPSDRKISYRRLMPWLILTVITLFISAGKNNPLYFIIQSLPGFSLFRNPSKFLIFYFAAACVLSGIGFDYVIARVKSIRPGSWFRAWGISGIIFLIITAAVFFTGIPPSIKISIIKFCLPAGLCCLTIGILTKNKLKPILLIILYVIVITDLWTYGAKYLQLQSEINIKAELNRYAFLQRLEGTKYPRRIFTTMDFRLPNITTLYNLSNLRGYDPVYLGRYGRIINYFEGIPLDAFNSADIHRPDSRLLSLLGAEYLISPTKELELNGISPVAPGIYRNKRAIPRVMLINEYVVMPDETERFKLISDPAWNPLATAIVENKHEGLQDIVPGKNPATVEIENYEAHEIVISTDTGSDSILVLNEPYAPGWQAFVDGQRRPVFPVNQIHRGIVLNRGKHSVKFIYTPTILNVGIYIALISLAIIALLIFLGCQKKEKSESK